LPDCPATDSWKGEGRTERRTKFRRLTFWPTVEAVSQRGQVHYEVCNLLANADTEVMLVQNANQCGFIECAQPPLHSIIMEEDYINPWNAQIRALWLEHSIRSPVLAPHLDGLFFEHFLNDQRHPVPVADLLALGILKQCRPDQGEVPNLPDPPAHTDAPPPGHGHDGAHTPSQPLHRYPAWVQESWELLQREGATELLEEGPIMYLDSFFISHVNHPRQTLNRPVRLDRHYEEWGETIKDVWTDFFDRNADFEVFLIQPNPPTPVTRGTIASLLVVQHPQRHHAAVLTTALIDDIAGYRIEQVAHSIRDRVSHQQILRQAGLLPECIEIRRQGLDPCIIRAGSHVFPPDQEIRLHDGLGLTIDVPMIIDEARWQRFVMPRLREIQQDGRPFAEPDATSFMARRPQPRRADSSMSVSSRTSTSSDISSYSAESPVNWKRAVVYALDGQTHSVLLPWREGEELYRRVAVAFGIPSSSILQLHHVGFRPGDLEQMELQALLLQQHHEARPAPNLQLILLDLEIHEDNPILPGIFRRKAHWAPKTTTIDTLFRVLGLTSTYRQYADESHLWLNNIRIDLQRNTPLHITDGDYVEIYIGDLECRDTLHSASEEEDETHNLLQVSLHSASEEVPQTFLQASSAQTHKISDQQQQHVSGIDACHPGEWRRHARGQRQRQPEEIDPEHRMRRNIWNRPELQQLGLHNEPIMVFDTWFISALNFPRCSTSRTIALPADVAQWDDRLQQIWRDRVHPHWPLEVFHVYPDPRPAPHLRHGGHLIVLQHGHPGEKAVLLSSYHGSLQDRFAQLVPRELDFDRFLWFQDHENLCDQVRHICDGFHGDVSIPRHAIWQCEHGQHLELHMRERTSDEATLMQMPVKGPGPHTHAVDMPAATNECGHFDFNPNAAAFFPDQPSIFGQPEYIQDLQLAWQFSAFAWEEEEASIVVAVWFVDHRWHWPHHDRYRTARLYADFTQWEQTILRTWRDFLQPGMPYEISRVTPTPPSRHNEASSHIVIIQHPRPDWVTSVVTLQDSYANGPSTTTQWAITTHEHIMLDNLLLVIGRLNQCTGAHPQLRCQAWYNTEILQLGRPILGHNGYGIIIHLSPQPAQVQQNEAEGPVLLQLSALLQPTL